MEESEEEGTKKYISPSPYLLSEGGVEDISSLGVDDSLGLPGAPRGVQHEQLVLAV